MGSGLQPRGAGPEPFCTSGRTAAALRLILQPQRCPAGGPGESQRPQRTGAPHRARSPPQDPRPSAGRQVLLEGDPRGAGVSPARLLWDADPPAGPLSKDRPSADWGAQFLCPFNRRAREALCVPGPQ